ncbi:gastrula zinc finger protein XlCGF28.1-like [Silurus meridionalis]|uniref:Alkylated DNA repair protein AlkB homologue 8 N-terminal domain-containing protein n=1 Tax=Silurus meridionalis TaxID=175797 RepID=A0A8T0ATY0_SILME|nr:hypothetical protein HF521_007359 [Silurus meridionalis]KAI5095252.1 gastrula zinc finger protein XlCGF28.1-like [Silurus meridionalis]
MREYPSVAPYSTPCSPLTAPLYNSNIFIKHADDTTVVGQISNNDRSAYREEIRSLTECCANNNLTLNATKTKVLIVDLRKSNSRINFPVYINGTEVEQVSSVHISENLSWHQNTLALVRKAQQCQYFVRSLKKAHLSPGILTCFYRCIIESILTNSITVWYEGFTVCERKALQIVVSIAQRITGTQLPAIIHLHHIRCLRRAHNINKDFSHPIYKLFNLLPSRRRYRNIYTKTSSLIRFLSERTWTIAMLQHATSESSVLMFNARVPDPCASSSPDAYPEVSEVRKA